jgi:hypothetical protein
MERVLSIYEMAEGVDPDALECSWLVAEPLAPRYATKRARHAVDTKKVLWSPRMRLEDGYIPLVKESLRSR